MSTFNHDKLLLQFKLDNEFELIFVVFCTVDSLSLHSVNHLFFRWRIRAFSSSPMWINY